MFRLVRSAGVVFLRAERDQTRSRLSGEADPATSRTPTARSFLKLSNVERGTPQGSCRGN